MTVRNSTWNAVVVRGGLTWFARSPGETHHYATPAWARVNLPRVVLAAGSLWFPRGGEGTVMWQCQEKVDTHRMVEELRADGWRVSDSGHDTGWFTVIRDGYAVVHLGIGELIQQQRFPLCALNIDAPGMALHLARYADLMGAAWRGSAGMNGCAQIRTIHGAKPPGAQPLWRWDDATALDATRCSFELRGSMHKRPMLPAERERTFVHQYDVRAMYLAAANVAMVGWSAPEHRGPQEFDPGRPGYWNVRRDQVAGVGNQIARAGDSRLVWLTTPVMSYLAEGGVFPEVMDSWTAERGGRYLKPWAERLTAALKATPAEETPRPSMERALKDTYKRTVGMLAREGGRIYRPDWRDEIVDRARVNLLRKCVGVDVLRFNIDSVWIASDEPATVLGRRLGIPYDPAGAEIWQVGKFRHQFTMTPAEYLARYERERVRV